LETTYFVSIVAPNHNEIITPLLNSRDIGVFKKKKGSPPPPPPPGNEPTHSRGSAEYYFSKELFFRVRTHVTKANACALRLIGKCFEKYEPFNYFEL